MFLIDMEKTARKNSNGILCVLFAQHTSGNRGCSDFRGTSRLPGPSLLGVTDVFPPPLAFRRGLKACSFIYDTSISLISAEDNKTPVRNVGLRSKCLLGPAKDIVVLADAIMSRSWCSEQRIEKVGPFNHST